MAKRITECELIEIENRMIRLMMEKEPRLSSQFKQDIRWLIETAREYGVLDEPMPNLPAKI